jgi:hypothetical protein
MVRYYYYYWYFQLRFTHDDKKVLGHHCYLECNVYGSMFLHILLFPQ